MALRIIYFSESPGSACHKYRVMHPIRALERSDSFEAVYSEKWNQDARGAAAYVFQRNSNHGSARLMLALSTEKKPFIYDIDDDIFQIPSTNPVFGLYFNTDEGHNDLSILARQVLGIRLASAVTVSSDRLVEVCSVINSNVHLLPNCVDISEWENQQPILHPSNKVRIFWGGSATHFQDLLIVRDVFPEIYRRFGDKVEIVIMGDDSVDFRCPTLKIPFGAYSFFQRVMRSCQIGVAPMADDLFNQAKSDLRLKEMACAQLPIVASPVGEYLKTKEVSFLCRSTEDWVDVLSSLVENAELRHESGQKSWEWVQQWDLHRHVDEWEEVLGRIVHDNDRGSLGKGVRVQSAQYVTNVFSGGRVRVGG